MRLIDNKKDMTDNNVWGYVYRKEKNIRRSDINIWDKQDIDIHTVTTSTYLIHNLYHNEIKR
jgi:hypothetical protein